MWEKRQCFKEKSKKTKFSTSSIIKKIKSTKIILKKQNKKNMYKMTILEKKQIKKIKKSCRQS